MSLTVNASIVQTDYPHIESSLVTACCDWMAEHFRPDGNGRCTPGIGLDSVDKVPVWLIIGCDGSSEPIHFCPGCGEALPVGQVQWVKPKETT